MMLVIAAISGTSFVLIQNVDASSTHMTLHNLTPMSAQLVVDDVITDPTCTADPNSTCEAGTEYIWYTININIPNANEQIWGTSMNGVYGHCDVYVTGTDASNFKADHSCSAAEKTGLKPPTGNQTK